MRRTKKKGPFFLFPFFFRTEGGSPLLISSIACTSLPPHLTLLATPPTAPFPPPPPPPRAIFLHLSPSSRPETGNPNRGPFFLAVVEGIDVGRDRRRQSYYFRTFGSGGERQERPRKRALSVWAGGFNCFYEFFRLPSIIVHLPNFRAIFFSLTFSGPTGIRNL